MVAHRARRESAKQDQFMSVAGYGLPVNAMLDFPATGKARLEVDRDMTRELAEMTLAVMLLRMLHWRKQ